MAAETREIPVGVVTITADEYFELRERANMNSVFFERINMLEERFNGLDGQVMRLSDALYELKSKG